MSARVVGSDPAKMVHDEAWDAPLASVRDLPSRFPDAGLRPVTLVRARELDARADPSCVSRVWLALETLQVTGSFKVRGALAALARVSESDGAKARVVAASAGNHAAGVAHAARALGVEATVVMPRGAPEAKRARVLACGARLVEVPSTHYDDAEARALTLAKETGATFVSPYDDVDVAAGNGGSLGFEIARALGRTPDVVVCPIGGGGLASGLGRALFESSGRDGTRRVWGAQSEACPAMAQSLESGRAVTRLEAAGETLAEGLEGGISETGFKRARAVVAGVLVVREAAIAGAMSHALAELGLAIEGSAATALAPILGGLPAPLLTAAATPGGRDLVAVITGRNVDRERLLRLPRAGD